MKANLRTIIDMMNIDEECDEQNIKERELRLFWERRAKDASNWGLFLNTTNSLAQILPMVRPVSDEHLIAAKLYLIGSAIIYVCLFLFFTKRLNTSYYILLYLIFRNSIRLFDFENTRPFID